MRRERCAEVVRDTPRRFSRDAGEDAVDCEVDAIDIRRIGRHFDLYERALFQTVIARMSWQENEARWLVETDRGDCIRARFVILAGGPLSRP